MYRIENVIVNYEVYYGLRILYTVPHSIYPHPGHNRFVDDVATAATAVTAPTAAVTSVCSW